jgi:hypothetical protein
MTLTAALEAIAQNPEFLVSDRAAAIRLFALVPAAERVDAVDLANRLGQDTVLPDSLLAEVGRARARLGIVMGRDFATDDLGIANLSPAAYLAYDQTIADWQRG